MYVKVENGTPIDVSYLVGLEERNLGRCPAKIQRPHGHVSVYVYSTRPLAETQQVSAKEVDRCPAIYSLLFCVAMGGETEAGGKAQEERATVFKIRIM